MTTIIKASVYTPKVSSLLYNRSSLMNVSVQIPSLLQQHPVGPLRLSSAVLPIPNKQHVATRESFRCRYAKDKATAQTKTVNDSRLWDRALKWLTHSFILMFFFRVIWMLPKWVFVVSSLVLLRVIPLSISRKMEPDNVSFDDLVGVEDAKVLFQKILHRIQNRKNKKLKGGLPDQVLLYGPQGTGKRTLVHALAREAKVSFFPVLADDIAMAEAGIKEIKSLFIEARASSPSIVYIENIDAISRHQGNDESDATLFELCCEIEKCSEEGSVTVLASTNKPETLDPTLMSSFFLKVDVGKPNEDSRRTFIGLHLNEFLKEEDREAICNVVASHTPGFVWTNLERIANESTLHAASRGDDYVTMDVVLEALEMVKPHISDDKNEPMLQDQMQHIAFGYRN